MKLAYSNLAWDKSQDAEVRPLLRENGVSGVEIAPGKVWAVPTAVTEAEARAYRSEWESEGLPIVAMQALVFGHPEFSVFGSTVEQNTMLAYLERIFDLAQNLGATALVFGSPKNRLKGPLSDAEAFEKALVFFRKVGASAHSRGVQVCLEANAREYGCDFVTTTDEAAALVQAVASLGFCLHMDLGCMELAKENVLAQIARFGATARHFHLSSYKLQPVSDRSQNLVASLVRAFSQAGSRAWMSVEMLNPKGELEKIRAILREIGPCFESR